MSRPVWIAAACVLLLKLGLLVLWGDRTPIFDEAGYLKTGAAVATWLSGGTGDPSVIGRIAWHNPGYGAIATMFALLGDTSGWGLRLLQAVAGVHTGLCVHALLVRRISNRGALIGASVVWLHPSMLFFGLTVWPVALTTWCLAAATLALDDFSRLPRSRGRATAVGWTVAPLPFLAPQALLLLPLIALVAHRIQPRSVGTVLGPVLALWLPWSVAASIALGSPTPMDFASRETIALGNNPHIPAGRGSSFDHADSLGLLRAQVADTCGDAADAKRVRCDATVYGRIAATTIRESPFRAVARSFVRVIEAYGPDTFLPRHLRDVRAFPDPVGERVLGAVERTLSVLQLLLVLGILAGCANLRGRRDTAALMVAVGLWTLGIALTIGATRLRQPALPWIIVATLTTLYPARPLERRTDGHVSG
jgi:hypothetical protein